MSSFRELQSDALYDLQGTGFSRRWLWELMRRLELTVGSRVLVAGRRSLGLVRFLASLGVDAHGIDDSPRPFRDTATGQSATAVDDIDTGVIDSLEPQSVDAVIVGGLRAFERPLNEPAAIRATAGLLAAIRPEGRFAVVSSAESSLDSSHDHSADCYDSLLQSFGSEVETSEGRNLFRWAASLWSSNAAQSADWQVCFTLPVIALDRSAWTCFAERSTVRPNTPCCDAWPAKQMRTVA